MIQLATFNCQNLKTSVNEIRELCLHHDVIFLQETWLLETELHMLSLIDRNFHGKGVSSMDISDSLITGRPYGGLAILWSKKLGHQCKCITFGDDTAFMGFEFMRGGIKYLFINVYMPFSCAIHYDTYISNLSKIDSIIRSSGTPIVFAIGDYNADPNKVHLFGKELADFCRDKNLVLSDIFHLRNGATYYSSAQNSSSWLDHAVCTISAHQLILSCRIYYDMISFFMITFHSL